MLVKNKNFRLGKTRNCPLDSVVVSSNGGIIAELPKEEFTLESALQQFCPQDTTVAIAYAWGEVKAYDCSPDRVWCSDTIAHLMFSEAFTEKELKELEEYAKQPYSSGTLHLQNLDGLKDRNN